MSLLGSVRDMIVAASSQESDSEWIVNWVSNLDKESKKGKEIDAHVDVGVDVDEDTGNRNTDVKQNQSQQQRPLPSWLLRINKIHEQQYLQQRQQQKQQQLLFILFPKYERMDRSMDCCCTL